MAFARPEQAVEVGHARLLGEIVHLVVEQDAGAVGDDAGAVAVQCVGHGDRVAVIVDDGIVRRPVLAKALRHQIRDIPARNGSIFADLLA
jgi:hypothetical protein